MNAFAPQAPPSPPPPQVPVHVCFSGALACSGCNPCPECKEAVKAAVLPPALASSGLNELSGVFFDLLQALAARGIQPAQFGVQVPPALRSMQEMALAFFQGYERGWATLHGRMQQGDLVGQFAVHPVGEPPKAPETPVEAAPVPTIPASPPPPAPPKAAPVAAVQAPAAPPPPKAMTAEQIAGMVAVPAPPASSNGVATASNGAVG